MLASSLVMVFFRNNGVYILFGVLVLLAIFLIAKSRLRYAKGSGRVIGCMAAVLLVFGIVTGPIYSFGGVVPSEASESVGIPLNQMARVVALDGEMSESDREYMNSIYPLEEYKSTYTPCCTDNLKWAPDLIILRLMKGYGDIGPLCLPETQMHTFRLGNCKHTDFGR